MGKNKPRGPKKTTPARMDLPKSVLPNKPREFKNRTLEEEKAFLTKVSPTLCKIDIGFVPEMLVPAYVIVNDELEDLLMEELAKSAPSSTGCCSSGENAKRGGGFLPALKQVANVAALPGIVKGSYGTFPHVKINSIVLLFFGALPCCRLSSPNKMLYNCFFSHAGRAQRLWFLHR